jgi:hypothetical protein
VAHFESLVDVFLVFAGGKKRKYLRNATANSQLFTERAFHWRVNIFNCVNFSTREIKPNQTDIGRKITKKQSPSITPYRTTTTSGQPQLSSSTPNSLISNGKRPLDNSSSSGDGVQHHTSQQQISNSHNLSYGPSDHHHHDPYPQHNSAINGVVGDDVDHHRAPGMGNNLSRNSGQQNHRNPDIMRKPIKWVLWLFF